VISGYEDICPACGFDTLLLVKLKKPEPRSFVQRIGEKWIAFFEVCPSDISTWLYSCPPCQHGVKIAPQQHIWLPEPYTPDIESFFEEAYPDDYYREFYADINILKPYYKRCYKVEGEKDDIIKKLDLYISHIKEQLSMEYRQEVAELKHIEEKPYSEDEFVKIAFNEVMKAYTPRLDFHPIRFA
jgi:hypothetical protein